MGGGGDSDDFEFINYDGTAGTIAGTNKNVVPSWFKYSGGLGATSTPSVNSTTHLKNISRIQITNSSMEEIEEQDKESTISGGVDGASVGDVLSTNSSINSVATRNTANDNTSASIDLLIGHIEGHRPLLEEEDDQDDSEIVDTTLQAVKPYIEMDQEIEYIPSQQTVSQNSGPIECSNIHDSVMFNSMTSSITSVIMKEPPPPSSLVFPPIAQPKDLLTDDPSPSQHSTYSDFETLSLQQIVDETEENRALDEEVAQSLNSQVIHDQLTHKDLFGSIPFTDKELIVSRETLLI